MHFEALDLDALVVVAYGLILPPPVLAAPRLGCFNIHASLLPRWRGAAPIQRALLAGDRVTGVTIMRMEAGLDTGPMLAVRAVDIEAGDTGGYSARSAGRSRRAAVVRDAGCARAGTGARNAATRGRRHLCAEDLQGRGGDRLACGCGRSAAQSPGVQSDPGRADSLERRAVAHLGGRACSAPRPRARRQPPARLSARRRAASTWRVAAVRCASRACSSPDASP